MTRGTLEKDQELLGATKGGSELNAAFIEHLNGTFRERLASLTRKCHHTATCLETLEKGMYLIGCTDNFCFPHHQLSKPFHFGGPTTLQWWQDCLITCGVFKSFCSTRSLLRPRKIA